MLLPAISVLAYELFCKLMEGAKGPRANMHMEGKEQNTETISCPTLDGSSHTSPVSAELETQREGAALPLCFSPALFHLFCPVPPMPFIPFYPNQNTH